MKIEYTNNKLKIEIETDSAKDAFKKLAEFQEVFGESQCGQCKGNELRFIVRTVDGNDYYELKCNSCSAKLAFGQHKTGGTLFPKRKMADGSYDAKNNGWHTWNGN